MTAEPDLTLHALYASVVEDDEEGLLFIGFAEGEDEEEPYLLFRQPVAGGPVWFEIGDEVFGAEDALQAVSETTKGLLLTTRPAARAALGYERRDVSGNCARPDGPQRRTAGNAELRHAQIAGENHVRHKSACSRVQILIDWQHEPLHVEHGR